MKKRALIVGGSGLIGRALTLKLKSNYDVTIATRSIDRCTKVFNFPDLQFVQNFCELKELEPFDVVVNLAGESIAGKRWTNKQKKRLCESRWQTTQALVDQLKHSKQPPSVYIGGSAIGIYGRQSSDQVIDETFTDYFNEFTHNLCKKWEEISLQMQTVSRVILLRTGVVLSRHGGFLQQMEPAFKICFGAVSGSGDQIISWVHIDDIVRAIIYLIDNPKLSGPFNITSPYTVSNKIFAKYFSNILHRPLFLKIPPFILRLVFGEMSDLILYGQNVTPKRLLNAGFTFKYPTLYDALASLYS